MNKISAFIYKNYKPPISVNEVLYLCDNFGLDIQFVIEAGSHHGLDTLCFVNDHNKKVFCFEPNPFSRTIFMQNMKGTPTDKFILFNFGLSNSEHEAKLFSPTIDLGSQMSEHAGNSSLIKTWGKSDGSGHTVLLKRLDSLFQGEEYGYLIASGRKGLLWLDVEGVALDSLKGMRNTLKCIVAAKIELEYSKQPGQWEKKSIFRVIYFMIRNGFVPYSGYLHPVSRGDIFFIHNRKLNSHSLIKSLKYLLFATLFYAVLYPIKNELNTFKSKLFLHILNKNSRFHKKWALSGSNRRPTD